MGEFILYMKPITAFTVVETVMMVSILFAAIVFGAMMIIYVQ